MPCLAGRAPTGARFAPCRAAGQPAPVLRGILPLLEGAGLSPSAAALWFTEPQAVADGAEPARLLHSDPDCILAAAPAAAADGNASGTGAASCGAGWSPREDG